MAKKQTIASEIGSALGAAAARAEQLIAGNPTKPVAKRTAAAKHSTTTAKKTTAKKTPAEPAAKATTVEGIVEVTEDTSVAISREAIAEQAYLYWEARGCQGGDPVSDWARAEEELKQRVMTASA